jgi:hypothetical protein
MTAGTHWQLPDDSERSRLDNGLWRGVSNGLPVVRWAPILDVPCEQVMSLLAALAVHQIAAHADVVGKPVASSASRQRWRIWVDATAHARAEDVLRRELADGGTPPEAETERP